jgi:hypothetical protein
MPRLQLFLKKLSYFDATTTAFLEKAITYLNDVWLKTKFVNKNAQ